VDVFRFDSEVTSTQRSKTGASPRNGGLYGRGRARLRGTLSDGTARGVCWRRLFAIFQIAPRALHTPTAWYSTAHSPGRCLAAPPPRAKPGSRVRSGLPHSRELTAEARPVELTFASARA